MWISTVYNKEGEVLKTTLKACGEMIYTYKYDEYNNMQLHNKLNYWEKITLKKLVILFVLTFGITNANSQTLKLENTRWKSKSFWGYGHGVGSEIFTENTKDPYNDFEFSIEFDGQRFVSTNLTLEQSDVKQIKGKYHIFSNNYIKLEIDTVFCINPNKTCSLPYKSDYTQIHKYWFNNDGKIEFLNTQYRDSWIDKVVNDYLKKSQNEKIKKAIEGNCYIEWLPVETKKIKGNSYTILKIVYEVQKTEKDPDIEISTNKYNLLNMIYIQLPSQKIYEMDKKGKLEEWKP